MKQDLQKIEQEVQEEVKEIEEKIQTSETFLLSAILALSGGFQDAYTYNVRDKVFYESAYDDGRMGESTALSLPGDCICHGGAGGRADRT